MDPVLLVMVAVLAVFVFVQFRSSKKRRAEQENLQTKMVPGAEVMTQFGVYGTLLSIDEEKNEALVETTPGTVIRLHRQTLLKVVEEEAPVVVEEQAIVEGEPGDLDTKPGAGGKGDA